MVSDNLASCGSRPHSTLVLIGVAVWISCLCDWCVPAPAIGSTALLPRVQPIQTRVSTIWNGIYTDAQAKRGERMYLEECASCHGETLAGGEFGPGLVGEGFLQQWTGKTVADLFERIRTSMPQDSPGRLSGRQYADIIAKILQSNEFPAGMDELTDQDAVLRQFVVERRTALGK